ncbi:MAG: uracil-DNA glycosylase [Pirellulaceae bacterium]
MDPQQLRRILLQQARSWGQAGLRTVPAFRGEATPLPLESAPASPPEGRQAIESHHPAAPATRSEAPAESRPESRTSASAAAQPASPPPLPPRVEVAPMASFQELAGLNRAQRIEQLEILSQQVAHCTLCQELAAKRTQTVFGVGNPEAKVCFFGEAPGADEDRQGEPFVGKAGKLLTQIIEACSFKREDVYILNTLKCRPPGNRDPTAQENQNCQPYFLRQLAIIQPQYIVCLGKYAAENLLGTGLPIGKLRGRFHQYGQCKVIATYHPAYLLRNPSAKKEVWADLKMMLQDMGIHPAKG